MISWVFRFVKCCAWTRRDISSFRLSVFLEMPSEDSWFSLYEIHPIKTVGLISIFSLRSFSSAFESKNTPSRRMTSHSGTDLKNDSSFDCEAIRSAAGTFLANFRHMLANITQHNVFHRVPLSSTHQFNNKGPLLFSPRNPTVQHQKPLSSTQSPVQHTPLFNTSLSSTPKSHQYV